jgi:hypothetical protein
MRERYKKYLREEERFIQENGGDLAGYIAKYGRASDPSHSGDGAEAIYAADMAALEHLRRHAGVSAR